MLMSAGYPQGANLTATIGTASLGTSARPGPVTFYSGSNNLGSAYLVSNNAPSGPVTFATLNATPQLANGQYTITANYAGDSNYVASSSAPTAVNIQPDFSVQTSTDALGIQTPGGSGSMTVSMTGP